MIYDLSFKESVYNFSFNYNAIDTSDIHKYLTVKNNMK